MREIYLDCNMGAAGDMLTAALYELLDEEGRQSFLDTMAGLTPEGVEVSVRPETKCGILGSHFDVVIHGEEEHSVDVSSETAPGINAHEHTHGHTHTHTHDHGHEHTHTHTHAHTHDHGHGHTHTHTHDHEHEHTHTHTHEHDHGHAHHGMADVESIIRGFGGIGDKVKDSIMEVYRIIAAAESEVHGSTVTEIHFHEVGMMDAIIDVTAVCLLMDMLAPDKVAASPVRVGWGHMRCAHGILPVPAPATASILKGVPTYAGGIEAELCTPTGAALLKYYAEDFTDQPLMQVSRIGYGMGTKDFEVCNCVRALLAE